MSSNNDYCLFYEHVLSSSLAPKITLPTRICDTTSTLIDNVYTNVTEKEHTLILMTIHINTSKTEFLRLNL